MPLNFPMWVMNIGEFLLWAVLGYFFWSKKLQKRMPAMHAYLLLRVGAMPVLLTLLYGQSRHWFNDYCFLVYFIVYWAVYLASAVTLYFVSIEIFKMALSAFPGLARFGTLIFRWAAVVSIIISLSTVSFAHTDILIVQGVAYRLMRSVSIIELCLLAFMCLAMNALRLSPRDLSFGVALGLGLLSTNDFVTASLMSKHTTLTDPLQFVSEAITLSCLAVWAVYFALPEPARKPVVVPASSTIYRWNEIASALGHKGANVAVQQPANSFFLTDVEKVVERVITRNLKESETNS